jgi:hypothetical protein
LAVRWNTLLGEADLWIDGTKVASASGTIYAPTSASTLYIGSSSAGSAQINAYVGNVTVLDAWVSDSTVSSWSSTDRTPIYGSTLLQGNFENKSLSASTGGTEFGTAYGLRIQLAGSSAPLADAFVLDVSGMDSGYALQPSSSSSIPQQYAPAPPLAQNVAGGVDVQPWNPGSLQ